MILKDGKFYEGDKEIPLEIGNKKQIELLRSEGAYEIPEEVDEEQEKEAIESGIELYVDITTTTVYRAEFECLCGKEVVEETEEEGASYHDETDLDGDEISCSCGRTYKVYEQGQKVKLIK